MTRGGSDDLRAVLARGSFDTRWVLDIFYDGQRRMQDVQVVDVRHVEDGTAKVQQSGSLTIIYQDRFARSIAPKDVEDLLSPFGTTLALYMLVSTGPVFTERVPMGVYVVTETPDIDTTKWRYRGVSRSKGDRIRVNFKDPFYKVLRNRFDVPGVTPSLTSTYAEIQRLTRLAVTRNPLVPDAVIPRALVYEEDRLDAVYELATTLDATPYMMPDGTVSLRSNRWGDPADILAAADAGEDPPPLAPRGYTAWTEVARNTFTNPQWLNGDLSALYNSSTEATADNVLTITAGVNDAPSLFSMLYPIPHAINTPWSARLQVRRKPGDTDTRGLSIRPTSYLGGSGVPWANTGSGNQTVILTDEWQDVEFSGFVSATGNTAGVQFLRTGPWPSGQGFQVRPVITSPTLLCPAYFDGDTQPGGGLQRTRWLGLPGASTSVLETREIIPEVPGVRAPARGTLVGIRRGMSADGVYNRVVVRAQGQQVGVLAAGEISDGALRATNDGGADSPFGRVPYFYSSQLITTLAQAQAYVNTWLPRLSRPQAVVLDIVELVNPLREVGDVLTVRRSGEEFLARIMRIDRGSGKTQGLKVTVVPNV